MEVPGRLERFLLKIMSMRVHPVVYLSLIVSAWYSAMTVFNGLYLTTDDSLVFMGEGMVNVVVGNVGVLTALALVLALRYSRWRISTALSLVGVSAWSFTTVMLAMDMSFVGLGLTVMFILLFLYVAIAATVHQIYGYDHSKSPRQEFYEGQKQARLLPPG